MVKRVPRKVISSSDYKKFYLLAKKFYEGAVLAIEHQNFNSGGVLLVHAAIALADSVTIRFSSTKAAGDNHYEVINLLREVVPENQETKSGLMHIEKIIDHKNAVSYQGKLYTVSDIEQLRKHYLRFAARADSLFLK
jgi:hypothetical protein